MEKQCQSGVCIVADAASTSRTTNATSTTRTNTTRAPRKRKEYVPEPRSGAHGLLVGLYTKAVEDGNDDAQIGKAELIARAQPYCDSDYSVPGGGSRSSLPSSLAHQGGGSQNFQARRSYITAWNAMKTLIDKGYVYRTGNPPRFFLSEQGMAIARVLSEAEGLAQPNADDAPEEPTPAATLSTTEPPTQPETQPSSTQSEPLQIPTQTQEEPIARSQQRLYLPPRKHMLERTEPRTWKRTTSAQSGLSVQDSIDVEDMEPHNVVVDLVQSSQEDVFVASEPRARSPEPRHTGPVRISISLIDSSPVIQHRFSSSPVVASSPLRQTRYEAAPSSSPCARTLEVPAAPEPRPPPPPRQPLGCHVLPAHSFTVHLIMDHREVRARHNQSAGSGRRVTFEEAMERRGIPCELRALELGDILWVARPKPDNPPDVAEKWALVQEVVLDTVVERKRLDDLTSSIFDGRWHEQKVRLDANVATLAHVRHGPRILPD